ncbi:MAG: S-methyl-5-thioribose-1-phosphate isomerase [Planctomycetota bacterium]
MSVSWRGGLSGHIRLIDQTLLPGREKTLAIRDVPRLIEAIRRLRVRGAPAIGVAGAFGVALAARKISATDPTVFLVRLRKASAAIASARPTAVNLAWAVEEILRAGRAAAVQGVPILRQALLDRALTLSDEERARSRAMGDAGARLIRDGGNILTHCNTGALATVGEGTALAAVFRAAARGKRVHVWVDETRPLLQGARLTAWELGRAGIPHTLICDNMAAVVMSAGKVDAVMVGADRIAANGDTANKIGTYGLSVLAKAHGVKFYVVAPVSTFDRGISTGRQIPIEERAPDEVAGFAGKRTAPRDARVFNPAFDVTPAANITAFVTDRGILKRPFARAIRERI